MPAGRIRIVAIGGESRLAIEQVVQGLAPGNGLSYIVAYTGVGDIVSTIRLAGSLPVSEIEAGVMPRPDHIHVLPRDREVTVGRGVFEFVDPTPTVRAPIDRLFRSLADEVGRDATGIVLGGHGVDGTLGIKRLKEVGALTVAQTPADSDLPAMPLAAIGSGMVDLILPLHEITSRLAGLGIDRPDPTIDDDRRSPDAVADTLRDILTLVRIRTGHDFSQYKRPTLYRRVARRMQVCQTETIGDYHGYLREHPTELANLLRDFLISVTNFFRDTEAYEVLEQLVIPKLFANKQRADQVRVWVAGCATGEEAYSLGMLLTEYRSHLREAPQIQIFATDIDNDALAIARLGAYPEAITVDVAPSRLDRFFSREANTFRVSKELRELVLFSPHNLLRDPPFSRLDLVACRNLLIYLNRDAQDRVLGMCHFGLRTDGFLFLGSSESAENMPLQFTPLDAKSRIYGRRATPPTVGADPILTNGRWRPASAPVVPADPERSLISFGELHHRLVEKYAPPSVMVNEELDIVHLSEHAGEFLVHGGGEPTRQLLRLVHPALRFDLRGAIYAARHHNGSHGESRVVRFDDHGRARVVELTVQPVELPDVGGPVTLIVFAERNAEPTTPAANEPDDGQRIEPIVRELEDELRRTRDQLRGTIEQYETSVEELKASNEELSAINEELRSATEELETSKEELQSVNEELITLNHELKVKVDELGRANSDLQNLMTSTDIAVLFLDRQLNIKRFTPRARDLFNIIASDVGRPLADLTHKLDQVDLTSAAAEVLDNLRLVEREVTSRDGGRYLARILPYRSLEDRIEGVLMTFVNITELKRAEQELRASEAMLRLAESAAVAGVWDLDVVNRRLRMSDQCARLNGFEPPTTLGLTDWIQRIHEGDRDRVLRAVYRSIAARDELDVEYRIDHPNTGMRWLWCIGRAPEATGSSIAGITIDVTDRRRTEAALRASEERFRLSLSAAPVVLTSQDAELHYTWGYVLGRDLGDGLGIEPYVTPSQADRLVELKREALRSGTARRAEIDLVFDGHSRTFDLRIEPNLVGESVVGLTTAGFDITPGKLAEASLRESDRRKDEFLATLSHELRNPLNPLRVALDVQKMAAHDPVQVQRTQEIMDRQVNQLIALVDDLLDLSRITQGKIVLRSDRIDVADIIRDAVEDGRGAFDLAKHELEVNVPASHLWMRGDQARIHQVVINLLNNAAKYTPDGGHVTIEARRDTARDVLLIIVSDTGIGIDPEALQSVFEIFVQCRDAEGRARGGLGIGLSLVRRLVELHGGRVMARSEGAGRGSEFTVELPLDRSLEE